MQRIRDIVTIWIGKITYKIMRLRGSHGAALPGLITEKLNPLLLNKLTELPDGVIIISGTNGKTTTTHLVSEVLTRMGKRVFTNHSGSNMTRGLLASIVRHATPLGKLNYDVAVLEVDEAYAAKLSPLLKPRASILTNVLRDQLDRFGEIDYTAKLLRTLAHNTQKLVVYNGCDRRLSQLHDSHRKARFVAYGFGDQIAEHFPDDDALYAARQTPQALQYILENKEADHIVIKQRDGSVTLDISNLPGWHNALNLTAVYALVSELYKEFDATLFDALSPPYGRGEVIHLGANSYTLQLVKNPAGFRTAMEVASDQPALLVINDAIADGRDVSWLWDVDLSAMRTRPAVAVAGTRAYDMAVRLKYEGIATSFIEPGERLALQKFTQEYTQGVVFLTYTAMLKSRKIMKELAK